MSKPKISGDEVIYMDETRNDVAEPLTSTPLEATFKPRRGSALETDAPKSIRPTSDTETDLLDPAEKSAERGDFDNPGIGNGLLSSDLETSEFSRFPESRSPFFPQAPTLSIPDVNVYQHKKTLAQGMMDLALLSANANQLRYVLQTDGNHPYFYPALVLIGSSLLLQIAVGIGLIWNSRYNVKDDAQMCKADRANNWTVIGIFLVTIFNVFISSFGVVDETRTVPA